MKGLIAALALLVLSGAAAGCASTGATSQTATGKTTLTVFAAASLKKTFSTLGARFQESHPDTVVAFSFAGSSDLVAQLENGAPADVFAAADTTTMDKVVASKLVAGTPVPFATNTVEIAVPADNPQRIAS